MKIKYILLQNLLKPSTFALIYHKLGFLPPPIGDLDGTQYQLLDPQDPDSEKFFVRKGAKYQTVPVIE